MSVLCYQYLMIVTGVEISVNIIYSRLHNILMPLIEFYQKALSDIFVKTIIRKTLSIGCEYSMDILITHTNGR